MKIKESNFVEELSHRNEKALEYVMVHYGGLVKSVVHRYLNVLSQYEEECINDVFFAVWEHIDSYDSTRNPFANWIGGIARLKALDYKRKYANRLLETSWENAQHTTGIDDAIESSERTDFHGRYLFAGIPAVMKKAAGSGVCLRLCIPV